MRVDGNGPVSGADCNEAAGAAGGAEGGGGGGGGKRGICGGGGGCGGEGGGRGDDDSERRSDTGRPNRQPTDGADEEFAMWEQWSMLNDLIFGSENGNSSEEGPSYSFDQLFERLVLDLGRFGCFQDNLPQVENDGFDIWEPWHILQNLILGSGADMEGSFEHLYARLVMEGGAAADDNLPAEDGEGHREGDLPTQQQH